MTQAAIRTKLSCVFLLGAFLMPSAIFAQADKGTILGTIQDSTGAGVPDAEVKAIETNTNIVHVSKANDAGNFTFPLLDPGAYIVQTDRTGFKRAQRTDVKLDANSTVRVD